MQTLSGDEQHTQRIRYEAFASFSTELNKCSSFSQIAKTLQAHVKFVIDSFIFYVYFEYDHHQISFDLFRGHCSFDEGQENNLTTFAEQALLHNLPATFTVKEIEAHPFLSKSIFNHPKIGVISLFPADNNNQYKILLINASRQVDFSIGSDFKFLRLISDLLGSKLSQIFLNTLIGNKNKELEFKNNEISFLNLTLEERVKQRTNDLHEVNQELQTLFYRTSHNFRAPLANILGLANLAALFTTDDDVLNLFEKCKASVGSLDKMLFKLTSIGGFDVAKDFEPIDFKDLIYAVTEKFRDKIDATKAIVNVEDQSVEKLICNKAMLFCIFENLFENSLCYSNDLPVISIKIKQRNNVFEIDFKDNGTGIEPSIQKKIFDMYYRGNNRCEGHGLGLYIVRKLLKVLNGSINLTSSLNGFTAFRIELPMVNYDMTVLG